MSQNIALTTEHLTVAELLGTVPTYDQLPQGWIHPKAIAPIANGRQVFVKNLRTRNWELGKVEDYYERGAFLKVRCGQRLQMVFSTDNIGIKGSM
ncbi:MAG TPA: hypothetical protein VE944_32825 [Nostoc sp.]|uniref:hypothetical protein n=1 Tax=Nostoc sp. TaxID=1180 RepID=UPI002D5F3548|nr:hypothetical protein [Nostoc sp.]HYX19053.1 hypothetical protein [Nostoc sp.]